VNDSPKAPQKAAATPPKPELKFKEMNGPQKALHLLKLVGFLVTFGFAFPNIFEDF
jgi:hypothetical protein